MCSSWIVLVAVARHCDAVVRRAHCRLRRRVPAEDMLVMVRFAAYF